ncbi:FtsX-like permease family protein [Streptomyces sp. SID14515]|uniref:FtsX-like permease family protein n=1 Tax=Streptomyces sp. SID14515 TaxID=2706074 RepID=UPI0013CA3970|nr:FtsX-like permease family protein [Streptomyces sp. SID14515]NEB42510.1 ABC transporter permease [Streptomyces sp. SID14515]
MTLLDEKRAAAPPRPAPPSWGAATLRDLGLGIRFAAAGGREGWIRTLLTAVGVGLGVALLLLASSVPHLLDERNAREQARSETRISDSPDANAAKSDSSVLRINTTTEYHDRTVAGYLMRPDGSTPVLPPGVARFPGADEMVVSPALRELLAEPGSELLRERLPYEITGTIGDAGLRSPGELLYYAGSDTLTTASGGHRIAGYGDEREGDPLPPLLIVLVVMVCVVLLVPVAIFIATAVRFGGDRRDRRLAALRLVGADIRTTRRIAAGEALFGAVLGLLIGLAFFLTGRQFVGSVEIWDVSAFPADLVPDPRLALLIVVAVPLTAVLVTLVAMRSVVIEPLGVVRRGRERGRRLWWRLLMPLAGLAVLGFTGRISAYEYAPEKPFGIAAGTVLVLVGLALLLPWLVEACVNRLRGGPVPWQLATRRLQLSSGAASRAVSGVTVAVAGAIALQMMFAAMNADFNRMTGQDPTRAQFAGYSEDVTGEAATSAIERFRATKGVDVVIGSVEAYASKPGDYADEDMQPTTSLTVGTCATLRELARIDACEDGDTFVVHPPGDKDMTAWIDETARKGKEVEIESGNRTMRWTLPADSATVQGRKDPMGETHYGIMATTGAVDAGKLPGATISVQIRVDRSVPDVAEYVRNTAAKVDPGMRFVTLDSVERDRQYASIQTGLQVGASAVLLLIAASMLVSQLEQLRERRRLLSVLVAFGTRRSTLGWSVLWQTAVPVVLGLAVAVAGGLGLGGALTWLIEKQVADWWLFWPMAGVGGALIVLVTLLSLPPLWRMMRPDGLRTE